MKKIYGLMLITLGLLAFSACESDRDSNPTLKEPGSFVLNVPPYADNNVYDLANSTSLEFTCSQPDYGVPMGTTYAVQMCLSDNFVEASDGVDANYVTLSTVYTSTKVNVDAVELALALVDLWDTTGEGDFPKETIPLYFRLKASLTSAPARGLCYSNVIKLPQVLGYKAEAPVALPTELYMTGDMEGASAWGNWIKLVAATETPGKFWRVQYFQAGNQMKFNTMAGWGGETAYFDGLIPDASKDFAGAGGVDDGYGNLNIGIGKTGWYTVVITAKLAGTAITYTLEFFEVAVYLTGEPLTGAWGGEGDAYKFTAPVSPAEPFVSPATVGGGSLRIFAKVPGIDWWKSEFVVFDGEIKYRENGGELAAQGFATNVGAGKKVKVNFITGEGSIE